MANSQTADWRLRETINKRIERQIREGYMPLTRYKTFFPFTSGMDIIDRRTGKIKTLNTAVAEYVTKRIGSKAAFIETQRAKGVTRGKAEDLYRKRKAKVTDNAKKKYATRLHALAEMNITGSRETKRYYETRTDAVLSLYLSRLVGSDGYQAAADKINSLSDSEKLQAIRTAKKRSCPGGHYTVSFYQMLGEYLGIDYPTDPPTP